MRALFAGIANHGPRGALALLLSACGGQGALGPSDASGAPDSVAALDGPSDAVETGAIDAVDATSLPDVVTPGCEGGSERDSGTASPSPPADGRCDLTPRLLVSAATLSVPSDSGPTTSAIGTILATPAGLYYTVNTTVGAGGLGVSLATGSLTRIPLEGGPDTQVASGYLFMRPVLNGTSLIVGERGGGATSSSNDAIAYIPLSGDAPTMLVTFATNEELATSPSTDGTFVYYGAQQPNSISVALRAIPASPTADPVPITVATGLPPDSLSPLGQQLIAVYPQGEIDSFPLPPMAGSPSTLRGKCEAGSRPLIACGSNACWLAGTNTIMQLAPGSGPPTTVATLTGPVAEAFDMAFDGSDFYVIGLDSAGTTETLERIAQGGGCPVVVATMPPLGQGSVSVDDECVYWSNSEGIFSMAKTTQGPFQQFQR